MLLLIKYITVRAFFLVVIFIIFPIILNWLEDDTCERETNRRKEEKEEIERSSRAASNLKKG